ncbi:MAG: hypothetical protein K6A23_16150 [Butyrivibrio sp.]|nr:hypothetical protein [Butyrivibrio sp.]
MNKEKIIQSGPIIAICDSEEDYCYRLDEYLRTNFSLEFEIYDFTNSNSLNEFQNKENIMVLIISEKEYEDVEKNICQNIILLQEDNAGINQVAENDNIVRINKYVPSKMILNSLVDVCMELPDNILGKNFEGSSALDIIGSISLNDKDAQMALAVELASELGQKEKVLFLELSPFSCLSKYTQISCEENLSDLLYYMDCNPDKFLLYFDRMVKDYDGCKIIAPIISPSQLKSITKIQWNALFKAIQNKTEFKKIIINLSEGIDGLYEILSRSSKIYMTVSNDEISQYKINQYETLLKENEYEKILAVTQRIIKPSYIATGTLNNAGYKRWAKELIGGLENGT